MFVLFIAIYTAPPCALYLRKICDSGSRTTTHGYEKPLFFSENAGFCFLWPRANRTARRACAPRLRPRCRRPVGRTLCFASNTPSQHRPSDSGRRREGRIGIISIARSAGCEGSTGGPISVPEPPVGREITAPGCLCSSHDERRPALGEGLPGRPRQAEQVARLLPAGNNSGNPAWPLPPEAVFWKLVVEARQEIALRFPLVSRIGEPLREYAQRRFAGAPHAARNPRYAPRPAVSIPAAR